MKQKIIKNSLIKFENENTLNMSLEKTKRFYRPLDPGSYLYKKLMDYTLDNKFNPKYIELMYVTLSAWNMNSRGAKLQAYELFEKSIIDNKDQIMLLNNWNIKALSDKGVIENLYDLYMKLNLVFGNKPLLVTFSKTMHFLLPELVVPIDRKYTLQYFYGNVNIPKQKDKQFNLFRSIELEYSKFACKRDLNRYIDEKWNLNNTKIMDNMVIGIQLK